MKKMIISILSTVVFAAGAANAGNVLFKDDFKEKTLNKQWNVKVRNAFLATWTVENGALKGKAYLKRSGVAAIENAKWSNYEFSAEFKIDKMSKNINAGFLFHFMPPGTRNKIYWTGFVFTVLKDKVKLQMVDPVWRKLKYAPLKKGLDLEVWHKVKIVVSEESIKCYLDGKLMISELCGKMSKGGIGLRVIQGAVALFKNVSVKEVVPAE